MLKVFGTGRLTKNPESRTVGDKEVVNFSVADNRKFGQKEVTTYLDCQIWGPRGKVLMEHFSKGDFIIFEGELTQRSWDQDGQKRSKYEVNVSSFEFGPKAPSGNEATPTPRQQPARGRQRPQQNPEPEGDDDIPF